MSTKKIDYKNKSVLLTSNCSKNKKLPIKLNKIIDSKFKNLQHIKICVILTARMGRKNKSYNFLKNNAINIFKKQEKLLHINKSYNVVFIDFSKKNNIDSCINHIKSSNIIWIVGGDTFFLWYHLKKTNIDKLICNRVKNNNVLYVGCCAGAIIAGKTLNPTYIARFYKKTKRYNLNNIYKSTYWNNSVKNKKTFNFIKNKDFLPHCKTKKSKVLNMYNNKTSMYCLPEYKPYTK
tara:strand:+ start:936 stop:1640 length:705 start_codon:yes stop_codon:yes gene_type:complete